MNYLEKKIFLSKL